MTRLIALLALVLLAPTALAAGVATVSRDAILDRFLRAPIGTVPLSQATGQVREFTLELHKIRAEIAPGVKVEQWAFAFPGQTPSVPGPELRVTEGDLVRIRFRNTLDQPHTIHPHGIVSVAQRMDGLVEVLPGQEYTYEFVATEPGTHAYHCHFQTNLHLDMGMYGALIVEPRDPARRFWRSEHTLVLDEWDARQDPSSLVHRPQPNYFLVNGKAAPLIPDLPIPPGDVALVRLINLGSALHSLHLHGVSFLVVAKDGHDLPAPYEADTIAIAPGERYDIVVRGRDGDFVFHDHTGPHATNDGVYPGGMHFMVRGGPALDEHGRPDTTVHAHAHGHAPAAPSAELAALPLLTDADAPVLRAAGFKFGPNVLRVKAGTTVTWANTDFIAHGLVIRGPDGAEETRALNRGGRTSVTFTRPGVYTFHCLPHPFMTGTILVE